MTIQVAINHKTRYRFDRLVSVSPHVFRLRPAAHCRTPVNAYSLRIGPAKHFINWQQDPFGNFLARVVFTEKCRELDVEVEVVAELSTINPFDFFIDDYAEHYPFAYEALNAKELQPYLEITDDGPLFGGWLAAIDRRRRRTCDFLVDLNHKLHADIAYNIRMEAGVQSCEQTLALGCGSCRDSAWMLVQALRHMGLAARFVSGYLVQLAPDVKALDGPSGPAEDFTDLHAWAEVYVPGAGWIGLDPTSGLLAGEGHIPLACTPDPASAAPVSGATDTCGVEFSFSNTVTRLREAPRVTKPYSDEQWRQIDALGQAVDAQLQEGDVRLTMGGEPTFVSVDDMEGAEWNIHADGAHKRARAQDLTCRLRDAFAPGAMLHYGQGKWYPGEPLPRWQYGIFWRKDGQPVWRDRQWQADINLGYGQTANDAGRFINHLADRLGIGRRYVSTGYEDSFYYLWQEDSLPENVNPLRSDLNDPIERRTLSQLLNAGLGEPAGYALPIKWDWHRQGWRSGPWRFRRGALFLIPGNSPMGMRLPLSSLPWVAPDQREHHEPQSLFAELPPLGDYHGEVTRRYSHFEERPSGQAEHLSPQEAGDADTVHVEVPHTALCVQAREGRLHVFLPPMSLLEHYLELVAAIEATAGQLRTPVVLEGYPPPHDYRLERLLVTPDPGVIEVNIHPAASWPEWVARTTELYAQARLARLGTEKFMLDGRHTGTGGGNHITLGGPTPADSPLLRRPDLLRSLITYWQHHPGLSYLFSGLFIGPTSQAPRVDEGRDDKLYELEIAFQQMPAGEVAAPWLVDRLLRHLLTDITGNTHRAEFCIDKLYSPDSASGRLGLLELRAFEMPPHPRMALVQALLLRTLVAWFWRQPYQHGLVRWGTQLHDRFMLPHYVDEDLQDVVRDLNRAGYAFDPQWLAPFLEFRFPRYGSAQVAGMELELRCAIEPWHVLGEEVGQTGTARFVDSSVERLQVKVSGHTEGRYVLVCNGRRLPLRRTATGGVHVAGVRYRAWQPPSALHPTIAPQLPLVVDVIDTWNGHYVGGCTYHVTHPGGRGYHTFPVNGFEAESRRINRFWDYGHTPGPVVMPPLTAVGGQAGGQAKPGFAVSDATPRPMAAPPEALNKDYPCTLDLRYNPG